MEEIRPTELLKEIPQGKPESDLEVTDTRLAFKKIPDTDMAYSDSGPGSEKAAQRLKIAIDSANQVTGEAVGSGLEMSHTAESHTETINEGKFDLSGTGEGINPKAYLAGIMNGTEKIQ